MMFIESEIAEINAARRPVDQRLVDGIANGTIKILNKRQIRVRLDISRSTLDRWLKDGKFPKPDIMYGNSGRWTEDTFKAYLKTRLIKKSQ